MAFFKEPLHNVNDIKVSNVKYTDSDVKLSIYSLNQLNDPNIPINVIVGSTDTFGLIVLDDAIHILGARGDVSSSIYSKYHLKYTDSKSTKGYQYLEPLPFPYYNSSSAIMNNELYFIGGSGFDGKIIDKIYQTIYKYNKNTNKWSVFGTSDYSLEYSCAVSAIDTHGNPVIYILGGAGGPSMMMGISNMGYTIYSSISGEISNINSHGVILDEIIHIFSYNESTGVTSHTADSKDGTVKTYSSFNIDKISSVVVGDGKIYAFTYHSGVYYWDPTSDTWNLIPNTTDYYFLPRSVVFYNNQFHVFGILNGIVYTEYNKHRHFDGLYTLDLGDTQ